MMRIVVLVRFEKTGEWYLVDECRTKDEAVKAKLQAVMRFGGAEVQIRRRTSKFYPEVGA